MLVGSVGNYVTSPCGTRCAILAPPNNKTNATRKTALPTLTTLQAGKNPNDIPWHKSEAKNLLKKDINDGRHKEMKPEVLHGTREEYQAFPLKTFRNHIYQEVDSRAKRAHRYAKKKKRASFVDPGFGV
jgi:hypothetical protein